MTGTAITITLYSADNEVKQTYTRTVIPWGILKKAIALTRSLDQEQVGSEDIDAVAALVVEAFGSQFTVQDLDQGADIGEMMSVLQGIVARASALVKVNPTVTPTPSKRSR